MYSALVPKSMEKGVRIPFEVQFASTALVKLRGGEIS